MCAGHPQVPASPNPEWQPLAIGQHSEAAQLLHSVEAKRIRVTICAEASHASPAARLCGSVQQPGAAGPAASGRAVDALPVWVASLHEPHTADADQLRTSDSVDSIELLQGGAHLTPVRSGSVGSAACSRAFSRGGAGSARRRQLSHAGLATAGSGANEHNSSGCADDGDPAGAQPAAAMHSANGTHAAVPAADSKAATPVAATPLPPPAALLLSPFALEGGRHGSGSGADARIMRPPRRRGVPAWTGRTPPAPAGSGAFDERIT
jgi:hypothetical protein